MEQKERLVFVAVPLLFDLCMAVLTRERKIKTVDDVAALTAVLPDVSTAMAYRALWEPYKQFCLRRRRCYWSATTTNPCDCTSVPTFMELWSTFTRSGWRLRNAWPRIEMARWLSAWWPLHLLRYQHKLQCHQQQYRHQQ